MRVKNANPSEQALELHKKTQSQALLYTNDKIPNIRGLIFSGSRKKAGQDIKAINGKKNVTVTIGNGKKKGKERRVKNKTIPTHHNTRAKRDNCFSAFVVTM
ncbi:MAG: hypothetical protein ABIP54_01690 [Candidatus Andersenbacteria bacterium]